MFTGNSYREYFLQLLELEQHMLREAGELAQFLPEGELAESMRLVAADEARHVGLVEELMRLSEEA